MFDINEIKCILEKNNTSYFRAILKRMFCIELFFNYSYINELPLYNISYFNYNISYARLVAHASFKHGWIPEYGEVRRSVSTRE